MVEWEKTARWGSQACVLFWACSATFSLGLLRLPAWQQEGKQVWYPRQEPVEETKFRFHVALRSPQNGLALSRIPDPSTEPLFHAIIFNQQLTPSTTTSVFRSIYQSAHHLKNTQKSKHTKKQPCCFEAPMHVDSAKAIGRTKHVPFVPASSAQAINLLALSEAFFAASIFNFLSCALCFQGKACCYSL